MPLSKVIIVGAGPSGLLLALLLAKAGINVELLEQTDELDKNPRASHYTAESCYEFDRAGILDQIEAEGFFPNGVSWRRLDENKTRLLMVRNPEPAPGQENDPAFKYRMICLPLHRLGKILEKAVLDQPSASIRFGYKVVEIGQDESAAWVKAETSDGTETRSADYIVGCDGANSIIRRRLFGDWEFPGFTWDKQIVATNMYYDFSPYDYDDSQFFVHPEHWHMVAKIQEDGLCRVTYGEQGGLTYEEMKTRQPDKFQAFLPGNPTPDRYKLVAFSPYKVHQRCVEKMRVGRFLLAADAAHLCNPWGGLGLTGGIADVGSLYDSLLGIHTGRADDEILARYSEERIRIWHEIINPRSQENMKRLFEYASADEFIEKDPFYKRLKAMETAPPAPNPGLMSLQFDMRKYWRS